jgi:hypothetical protein
MKPSLTLRRTETYLDKPMLKFNDALKIGTNKIL